MPLTDEEKQERRKFIHASEAPAILGLSEYKTPLQVYRQKVDGVEPPVPPAVAKAAVAGHALEAAIAQMYVAQDTDPSATNTAPWHQNVKASNSATPWLRATPDFVVVRSDKSHLLEIKNRGFSQKDKWGPSGGDWRLCVDREVAIQVQLQMYCTGHTRCDVAVLIGGNDLRVYTVPYEPALAAELVRMLASFKDRLELKVPPPTTGGDIDVTPARTLSGEGAENAKVLVDRYVAAKEAKDRAHDEFDRVSGQVKWFMRGSGKAVLPDGSTITNTTAKGRRSTDWAAVTAELVTWYGVDTETLGKLYEKHVREGTPYQRITVKKADTTVEETLEDNAA
jgi:putative phage-type endonuclease